ncbi:tetratricopeptide repeat protein [Actinokineospora xionganensis]|uniref:Tetratricopeptide repeat protein n=1 Tax=Actinokineospora xionganensis TaxID=2684470 RepID=A0ABR7KZZ2_9PSEU|nr:tetratricopeptide repeat protein [Actinokineospora xionganensis]MBC6446000.1 tetratricopeptide repeat protein [Actinokineospora xionganensis]
MDWEHVTCVRGESRVGSGYVVASGLVLCSAHVTGPRGAPVEVFRPGLAAVVPGVVVWSGTPGGRDDASLIAVAPDAFPLQRQVRWGRTVTRVPGLPCETWGAPEVVQQPGRPAEVGHLLGSLNPGDRLVGYRYTMRITGPRHATLPTGSPWAGLSGAPLFSGDLLIGVIMADVAGAQHGELIAVPAYVLWHDESFRRVLGDAGGRLAPVELDRLSPVVPTRLTTPSSLLLARQEVVPWRSRPQLMHDLGVWLSEPGCGVWLLHGSGGQGKTRVAVQLGRELPGRWSVFWPSPEIPPPDLRVLRDVNAPVLVVVDYANSRAEQLAHMLSAVAGSPRQIKLLLLARSVNEWWEDLALHSDAVADLLSAARVRQLDPLAAEPTDDPYGEAVSAFSIALPSLAGLESYPWATIAADLQPPKSVSDHVLTLHLTALADLLDAAAPSESTPERTAEDRVLLHERRHWRAAAVRHGLVPVLIRALDDVVLVAVLTGLSTSRDAPAVLRTVPGLADQPDSAIGPVCAWFASMFPPTTQDREFDLLQPDRLAERHVARRVSARPELSERLAEVVTRDQAATMLTVLTRAGALPAADPGMGDHVVALCGINPDIVATAAVTIAPFVEHPEALLAGMRAVLRDPRHRPALVGLGDEFPVSSERLADIAHDVTAALVAGARDAADIPGLALHLSNLSVRLRALGRQEDARVVAEEAVSIRRQLVRDDPTTYSTDLATSLQSLSHVLSELGLPEAALAACEEAFRVHQGSGTASSADRASILNTMSIQFAALGRWEPAVAAATESVEICRVLAEAQSDADLARLAMGLLNLANRLDEAGHSARAAQTSVAARDLYRELTGINPDAFRPDLALSSNNASVHLAEVQRWAEALGAAHEAVDTYRHLVESRPEVHRAGFATSLITLSTRYHESGRTREAVETAREATAIYRTMACARPAAHRSDLALSLNDLSIWLAAGGDSAEALEAIEEAVALRRDLADARPGVHRVDLAISLINASNRLSEMGRLAEAVDAASEAAGIYRALPPDRLDAHKPDFATCMNNLAIRLAEMGRSDEALTAARSATAIYRELETRTPGRYRAGLAMSLTTLSNRLGEFGLTEAVAPAQEAVAIYRDLARSRPIVHNEDLAMSLTNLSLRLDALAVELSAACREDEAIDAAHEAWSCLRQLSLLCDDQAPPPDVYRSRLAAALGRTADRLTELSRPHDALAAQQEAVLIWRERVAAGRDRSDLAVSLNNLSNRLADVGRAEDALASIDEAVAIGRDSADGLPDPHMAGSLNNLSLRLAEVGRVEEALTVINEAVDTYRALAETDPDEYQIDVAMSLNNKASRLGDLGMHEDALAELDDAIALYRQSSAAADDVLFELAGSMANRAVQLEALGDHHNARAALEESISVCQPMAALRPTRYGATVAQLTAALHDLQSRPGN